MQRSEDSSIGRQALAALAVLLVVVPGLLIGVSAAGAGGVWPPITDLRYLLVLVGLIGALLASGNRVLVGIGITALVLLDLAALDDITTGTQPSYTRELALLAGSLLLLSGWLARRRKPAS